MGFTLMRVLPRRRFLVPPREKRPSCIRLFFPIDTVCLSMPHSGVTPTDSPARIDQITVLTSYRAGSAESSCSPASRRVGSVRPPVAAL